MIDSADTVIHTPTGNRLIVACIEDGRAHWMGFPAGSAPVGDFELVKKAKPGDRTRLLKEWAKPGSPEGDARTRIARRILGPNTRSGAADESNPAA